MPVQPTTFGLQPVCSCKRNKLFTRSTTRPSCPNETSSSVSICDWLIRHNFLDKTTPRMRIDVISERGQHSCVRHQESYEGLPSTPEKRSIPGHSEVCCLIYRGYCGTWGRQAIKQHCFNWNMLKNVTICCINKGTTIRQHFLHHGEKKMKWFQVCIFKIH